MKCKSKCNYEIISLCDIKEFNKEIAMLKNIPWSQITIPETLTIPKERLPIKSICKIYITVKIDSSKIIETPRTLVSNSEGLILTGKKLLVDGKISEKIIYNSSSCNKSLNSIEFKIPFSTYIVINNDADIYNDKFNIKTCIEDVFVTPISERTIFQSTTLFLFANIISPYAIPPEPKPERIYDKIIVNNENNEKVISIKFDLQNKIILVESTGKTVNEISFPPQEYFSLTLRSYNNFIKAFSALETNTDANNIYDDLNNNSFNFNDFIELKYIDNSKIYIASNDNQFNLTAEQGASGIQYFYITEKGLIPKN